MKGSFNPEARAERRSTAMPLYAGAVEEELLIGGRLLRQAFLETPLQSATRSAAIVDPDDPDPPMFLIHRGLAYCSCTLPDGRRSILDLLLPGDFGGIEHLVMDRPHQDVVAAPGVLGYRALSRSAVLDLMGNRAIALKIIALGAEARRRMDRHAATLSRFDARERMCAFLLDLHDRLRRRELIARPTFNLPLTQEQIADHLGLTMVHVNRILRQLREERIALIDRHVVMIMDIERLREIVYGLPPLFNDAALEPNVRLGDGPAQPAPKIAPLK